MNHFRKLLSGATLLLWAVCTPAQAQSSASADATVSATVIRAITVTKNADLSFGTVVRGAGTLVVSTAGARSVTQSVGFLASSTASAGQFTIGGEGGQAITVTVPATITLSKGADTLSVATSNDLSGAANAQAISGAIGSAGTLVVKVGGTLTLTDNTPVGAYSGTLTVSAAYN